MKTKRGNVSVLASRWDGFTPENSTLRELKEESATLRRKIEKESKVFSLYSLFDGGKKLSRS